MKESVFTFDPRADTLLVLRYPNANKVQPSETHADSEPEYDRVGSEDRGEEMLDHVVSKMEQDSPATLDSDLEGPKTLEPYSFDGTPTQVEFRVSSRHLSLASPVFRAMLESQFKESRRNSQGFYEMEAIEWDAEALVILLDIIHGHHQNVPKQISVETLSQVAILVDYYGCHEIMDFIVTAWLSYMGSPDLEQDPARWMFISWVFRKESLFSDATLFLLLHDYGKCAVELPIPQPILDKIEHQRFHVLDTLFERLYSLQEDLLQGKAGCSPACSSMLLGSLMRELRARGLPTVKPTTPFDGWRVEDARSAIVGLSVPRWRVPGKMIDHPLLAIPFSPPSPPSVVILAIYKMINSKEYFLLLSQVATITSNMASTHAIYPSLRDKTVLITGGAEGIGASTVELFALQGCKVIFLDISASSAQQIIGLVVSHSKDKEDTIKAPIFYECDVSDLAKLQSTVREILLEHGPINVLVNNAAAAGNRARLATEDVTAEDWDFNINTNLRHVFFLSQAIIPSMKEAGGGSIINLGSITWRIPAQGTPVYGACKAAIMGLTRTQSKEFGRFNIRINSVMPGAIATDRQRAEVLTPEYREEVMRGQSLQRDLVPEDVAKVIVFLGSDEASGVTGSSYVVDGGWCSDP
ncbi:hypothetical protein F66182_11034 [Fusarium sp. NRRL 66182]|nr:hypothetical protein F66182_11034 [Fusarium sp. NRRL 66182]